jgi:hypothetical protein
MPAQRHTRLQDFGIGCIVDDLIAPISSEVRTRYESLISALTKAGATLSRDGRPELKCVPQRFCTITASRSTSAS